MSKRTEIYRNPPAPVGYTYQPKIKPVPDNIFAFLKHLEANLDFMDEDDDPNIDLSHFVIMTDEEGSDEEAEKNDSQSEILEVAVKKETAVGFDEAVPSKTASSHKTSPKKAKKRDRIDSGSESGHSSQRRPSMSLSPHRIKEERVPQHLFDDSTAPPEEEKRRSRNRSIKRERRHSDSDSDSSHYSSGRRLCGYSPSPSPVRIKEEKVRVKEEEYQPEHLYGCYHCDVCNITMNSVATYDSHVIGKRHLKALKAKNVVDTVARSLPTTEEESKKPQPGAGVVRVRVNQRAKIQDLIERQIKHPIPGLDHVTEIQGFAETSYFCALCNSPCSANSILPHLNGYKHMLKCLKLYRPELYEKNKYKSKFHVEDLVKNILGSIVRREGNGMLIVEQEKLARDVGDNQIEITAMPSTSSGPSTSQDTFMDFQEMYDQSTIPDTSKSGYYCKICESHMNSAEMWENHVRGKRHITNVKKPQGSIPSKIKTIPVKGARAHLMDLIEYVDEPIVGLGHVRETQNHQTCKDMYQCYLCGACLNTNDIVEHLISQKHRMKYLQEIQHMCLDVVKDMDINSTNACAIVHEACRILEEKEGRGKPNIFLSKDCFPPTRF